MFLSDTNPYYCHTDHDAAIVRLFQSPSVSLFPSEERRITFNQLLTIVAVFFFFSFLFIIVFIIIIIIIIISYRVL